MKWGYGTGAIQTRGYVSSNLVLRSRRRNDREGTRDVSKLPEHSQIFWLVPRWGVYNGGSVRHHPFLCNISPSSSCLKLSVLILAPPTRKLLPKSILPFQCTYLSFSCVGVWQNDRVEIIANDQGNRTTPSYVSFSDNERLIGDAAKNQVAMNPHNT